MNQKERGAHAERLLNDEVLQGALFAAEDRYTKQWKEAESRVEQEELWYKVNAIRDLRRELHSFIWAVVEK